MLRSCPAEAFSKPRKPPTSPTLPDVDDERVLHGDPIRFTDGASVAVETTEGFVHLVTRDTHGGFLSGVELAPQEAQQLGQSLLAAAFIASPDAGPRS